MLITLPADISPSGNHPARNLPVIAAASCRAWGAGSGALPSARRPDVEAASSWPACGGSTYKLMKKLTPYKTMSPPINNFYEFGTGKGRSGRPGRAGLKTRPWTVVGRRRGASSPNLGYRCAVETRAAGGGACTAWLRRRLVVVIPWVGFP